MKNMFTIQDGVLTKCLSDASEIIIPADVKEIGMRAFAYNKTLRKVTIPETVESIGREAFLSCKNLEEVSIGDGVKRIGAECFAYCENLVELYIPESVEYIGWDIAAMNEAGHLRPNFRCYRLGAGKDWHENWNRIYHDIRFGDDRNHMFFHNVYYGATRNGFREDVGKAMQIVTNIPHGTGVPKTEKDEQLAKSVERVRIPDIRLRLWLSATKIPLVGNTEYALTDEEREMLPRLVMERSGNGVAERVLDKPWEIIVNDETNDLTSGMQISAYVAYGFPFDGKTLTIAHDMPFRKSRYDSLAISRLKMGETVIAEKKIANGNGLDLYDVRLFIQWPEQEIRRYTIDEALSEVKAHQSDWAALNDENNKIGVYFARGTKPVELYKSYLPSAFPEAFFDDFAAEQGNWNDLGQIVVQPLEVYQTYHDYSDDYKCAAGISDDDDTGWYETHTRNIGQRLSMEMRENISHVSNT